LGSRKSGGEGKPLKKLQKTVTRPQMTGENLEDTLQRILQEVGQGIDPACRRKKERPSPSTQKLSHRRERDIAKNKWKFTGGGRWGFGEIRGGDKVKGQGKKRSSP